MNYGSHRSRGAEYNQRPFFLSRSLVSLLAFYFQMANAGMRSDRSGSISYICCRITLLSPFYNVEGDAAQDT